MQQKWTTDALWLIGHMGDEFAMFANFPRKRASRNALECLLSAESEYRPSLSTGDTVVERDHRLRKSSLRMHNGSSPIACSLIQIKVFGRSRFNVVLATQLLTLGGSADCFSLAIS